MSLFVFEKVLMLYARRFPIRRGKLRVIDSLWQTALINGSTHRLATLKYRQFKMPCDLSEMLQRQFYFFGTYFLEEEILACWQTMAQGAKVVLDVGANAGVYSLAALAIQPGAIVHAFEPTPEIAARLRTTAEVNGLQNLYVHEAAVLGRNGEALLKRFRGDFGTNEGMNFVSEDFAGTTGERVPAVCLDRFCRDRAIERVDLLKLDIQGHEYSALRGAQDLLRSGRIGTIFMELNWVQHAEATCSATESVHLLEQADYLFSQPGKQLKWQKAGNWLCNLNDVLAHRPS
jgi:FkbM family methyltransferase